MTSLENLAKEYISQAKDEIKTGRKIADKIREVADNIENELVMDGMNMTEAYDSKDFIGVGIGFYSSRATTGSAGSLKTKISGK